MGVHCNQLICVHVASLEQVWYIPPIDSLSQGLQLDAFFVFRLLTSLQRLAFLTGAGVSVGAGIPDFRSPGGMYDTLRPELLTASHHERAAMSRDPTAVVSKDIFFRNPLPYLELRRPFILGLAEKQWRATISHWFVRSVLQTCFRGVVCVPHAITLLHRSADFLASEYWFVHT